MFKKFFSLGLAIFMTVLTTGAFAKVTYEGKLNINTATAKELAQLPYVGDKRAQDIVNYRKTGNFKTVADLAKVKGVSESVVKKLANYLAVTGDSTFKVQKVGKVSAK